MGAKAMQYLTSGHGMNPSMGPLSRRGPGQPLDRFTVSPPPVAQGPEVRHCTPSALRVITGQWFLKGSHGVHRTLGRVVGSRTVRGRKPSIERHKDVLERVLEPTTRPSGLSTVQKIRGGTGNRSRRWPEPGIGRDNSAQQPISFITSAHCLPTQ